VARKPPGFAFVEMEDKRDAEDAVSELDGTRMCGNRVKVELSRGGKNGRFAEGFSGGARGGRSRSRSPVRGRSPPRRGRSRSRSGGRRRRSPSYRSMSRGRADKSRSRSPAKKREARRGSRSRSRSPPPRRAVGSKSRSRS